MSTCEWISGFTCGAFREQIQPLISKETPVQVCVLEENKKKRIIKCFHLPQDGARGGDEAVNRVSESESGVLVDAEHETKFGAYFWA